MELPAYHMPTLSNMLRSMWERGRAFIKEAGTLILLSSIVIWFLNNFGFTQEGLIVGFAMDQSLLAAIGGGFTVGTVCALAALFGFVYLLIRRPKNERPNAYHSGSAGGSRSLRS